ncbi:uncharacterized protein JCM6883_002013 [Sporobolomyces salmoneus]|uniref:uncharacterized protein n=1 Tax=Sporobolomyces salmoneus TaxID=183962 RepID=UPI003177CDFE
MGPSGAGKSTFLDAICGRSSASGQVTINGSTNYSTQDFLSFVEQDDALLGVLTVRETVAFAAKLSLGSSYPGLDRHIDDTLRSLGLQDVANNKIGTPLQRGISGGQKRRVTVAQSVVGKPSILVLDEPTSGLDASSSREVVTFLRHLAHEQNLLVICTIHQPNFETFSLFDNLLVLAGGQTMYNGPVSELDNYLTWTGSPTPKFVNPADHVIQLVNTEFMKPEHQHRTAQEHLSHYSDLWTQHSTEKPRGSLSSNPSTSLPFGKSSRGSVAKVIGNLRKLNTLMHRNLLNYSRNILAYGIRLAMFAGMGLLLATIWIRLGYSAEKINDRLSVSFFAVAFLGFMSVAGIPSFLEERSVFIRERRNGLYGPGVYTLAQSIVSVPFLFLCSLVFSLIIYWSIGMNPGATHFFRFLIYLFLALYTAESQSLLVAVIFPLFVAALAIASFANGLWMCNMGYFIRTASLPRFWFYVVHWIDYQTYSFNLLVKNDFSGQILSCPTIQGVCSCPMASSLTPEQCALTGDDVVRNLEISGSEGFSVGILVLILVVYRVLLYLGLRMRK